MYRIVTGVTSDVGVPSTYLVNPILPLKCNFACNLLMYINSRWDIIYSMFTTDALYEIEHMRIFTFIIFYFQKQFRYLLQIYDSQIHINCMSGTDGTSVYITICMDGIVESTPRWKSHGNVVPSLKARFMGPTWGPIWGRQDPMLAPWTLLSGMEPISALPTSSLTGGFPHKGPVMRGFDIYFGVRYNKLLNKQLSGRWVKRPWLPDKGTVIVKQLHIKLMIKGAFRY